MPERMARLIPDQRSDDDPSPTTSTFEVVITSDTPSSASEYLECKELHGNRFFHRRCRWSPRVNLDGSVRLPDRGDKALLKLDDDGNPWILEYWPYA